jgi:hypothetical protein
VISTNRSVVLTCARYATVLNDVEPGYHYVTIILRAELDDPKQQPRVLEPERCEEWVWGEWPEGLPQPLFSSVAKLQGSGWVV